MGAPEDFPRRDRASAGVKANTSLRAEQDDAQESMVHLLLARTAFDDVADVAGELRVARVAREVRANSRQC